MMIAILNVFNAHLDLTFMSLATINGGLEIKKSLLFFCTVLWKLAMIRGQNVLPEHSAPSADVVTIRQKWPLKLSLSRFRGQKPPCPKIVSLCTGRERLAFFSFHPNAIFLQAKPGIKHPLTRSINPALDKLNQGYPPGIQQSHKFTS